MIFLFKYCADMKNCENFRDFGFIYIYIHTHRDNNHNNNKQKEREGIKKNE